MGFGDEHLEVSRSRYDDWGGVGWGFGSAGRGFGGLGVWDGVAFFHVF